MTKNPRYRLTATEAYWEGMTAQDVSKKVAGLVNAGHVFFTVERDPRAERIADRKAREAQKKPTKGD